MRTVQDFKRAIQRGARVLVSSGFVDLFPGVGQMQVLTLGKLPTSLLAVNQKSSEGWGCLSDILFALSSELPVYGFLGQVVAVGASERHMQMGFCDYQLSSLDVDLWVEGLGKTARWPGEFESVTWDSLISLSRAECFSGSYERPILFLDRDNVIVPDVPYNNDPDKVTLNAGVVELIHRAHQVGAWVAMVSNQSGLGRGKIRFDEFGYVHRQMLALLAAESVWIDHSEWASFIPDSDCVEGILYSQMRKPRPGMFWSVQRKLKGHLAASHMIGDSASDLLAAEQAGVAHLWLLKTEKVAEEVKKLESLRPELRFHVIERLSEVMF